MPRASPYTPRSCPTSSRTTSTRRSTSRSHRPTRPTPRRSRSPSRSSSAHRTRNRRSRRVRGQQLRLELRQRHPVPLEHGLGSVCLQWNDLPPDGPERRHEQHGGVLRTARKGDFNNAAVTTATDLFNATSAGSPTSPDQAAAMCDVLRPDRPQHAVPLRLRLAVVASPALHDVPARWPAELPGVRVPAIQLARCRPTAPTRAA